jgi:hypothetical protein
MAMADLIPTGRTSLVKRGELSLQVQTEYAHRPMPRITTTVQKDGQVLQKIERSLDNPIASIEEKNLMEDTIRKQHAEILTIIRGDQNPVRKPKPKPEAPPSEPKPYPESDPFQTTLDRLHALPGKHRVYCLDNEGNFQDAAVSKEFAKMFKPVFKNLGDLIAVFGEIPGIGFTRETGVYEVERNRLYLVSAGSELYIVWIERPAIRINYEREIHDLLVSH